MGKTFQLLLLGLLSSGLFFCGCNQQKENQKVSPAPQTVPKRALKIVVPNEVKDHWKSVEVSIFDHKISAEKTYTIPIGEIIHVPDSPLSLEVDTFLPSFIIRDNRMTSVSNETRNPAAYIVVKEQKKQVFAGWVFSLYPDAHAFQNSRYDINLVGYNSTN